jgi:hypothetical protein
MSKPDANGWLPIESAPKGRADILLWGKHGVILGHWLEANHFGLGEPADWFPTTHPTHWQPLPKPPVSVRA